MNTFKRVIFFLCIALSLINSWNGRYDKATFDLLVAYGIKGTIEEKKTKEDSEKDKKEHKKTPFYIIRIWK